MIPGPSKFRPARRAKSKSPRSFRVSPRRAGSPLELPAADLTLSTQGFAGPLTRTLLSEALGPEVTIAFRPGAMVITIDERILVAEKRTEWLGRLRNLGEKAGEAAQEAVLRNACLEVFPGE